MKISLIVPENDNATVVQNGKSDGNESESDDAMRTDGSEVPKTVPVDDPLERMLARQQQVEAEAEKENAEKLKQVESSKDPVEIGEEDRQDADLRSLFLAAENKEVEMEKMMQTLFDFRIALKLPLTGKLGTD